MGIPVATTRKVYEIFKLTVQLFEYRFKDMDLDEVIDELIDFTGVAPRTYQGRTLRILSCHTATNTTPAYTTK